MESKRDILDVEVSCFANYFDKENPKPINLCTWLESDKYTDQVEQIRRTEDKTARKRLKEILPAITPSGLFSYGKDDGLIRHSGLIQIDIDGPENAHIVNFTDLKQEIIKLPEIAYFGLSVSGRGYWGLIAIEQPSRHREHFMALQSNFKRWGIVIDSKCGNVSRLRGYSYDPEAYFNSQAIPYKKLWKPKPQRYKGKRNRIPGDEAKKVEACLAIIETHHIDITGDYATWFSLGSALACEFGEAGRDLFHRVSQYYPTYSCRETDRQYTHCLRNPGYTIATFYQVCIDYGIKYKETI